MIGKRIRRKSTSTSPQALSRAIRSLTAYVTAGHAGDKCIYYTSSGMLGSTVDAWQAEMESLAMESRSKFPVKHLVLSWAPGEQPTPEQCDEALAITLKHLGLEHHQAIVGLHADTGIYHLHLMVNRVDPVTEQATEINRGFDSKAIQQAAALVEHKQGWSRVSNAKWQVVNGGRVVPIGARVERDGPSDRIRDIERQSGQQTTISAAAERLLPILEGAASWAQLHRDLAAAEARYETKGSGAIIWFQDRAVKASSISSRVSLSKMERKLGSYQPASEQARPAGTRVPGEPTKLARASDDLWLAYLEARRTARAERTERIHQLRAQQRAERADLLKIQCTERSELRQTVAGEPRSLRQQARLLLEAQQREHRAVVADLHKQQRDLTVQHLPVYSTYSGWLRASAEQLGDRAAQELAALAGRKPVASAPAAPTVSAARPRTIMDLPAKELALLQHQLLAKEIEIQAAAVHIPVDKFTTYFTRAERIEVSKGAGLPADLAKLLTSVEARLQQLQAAEQEVAPAPAPSVPQPSVLTPSHAVDQPTEAERAEVERRNREIDTWLARNPQTLAGSAAPPAKPKPPPQTSVPSPAPSPRAPEPEMTDEEKAYLQSKGLIQIKPDGTIVRSTGRTRT